MQGYWLHFRASGDGAELLEHNFPTPHYYNRQENAKAYSIAWLIDGYFHTKKGQEYLNDMIARIALTVPIMDRKAYAPPHYEKTPPIRLKAFQNAVSLRSDYINQQTKHKNELSNDMVWWAIKFQTESFIRQFGGWFNYDMLEMWAFNVFVVGKDVKDRSTLKAKCRDTWMWYEQIDFIIPKRQRRVFTMSRAEAGRKAHEKLAKDTEAKVRGAITALQFLQEKITVSGVAKQAGVSRDTARKYLKEMGLI